MEQFEYTAQQMGLFHKLINNTPFIYYIIDRDWRFVLSEGLGLKAIGLEPGQIVGMTVMDLYGDNEELTGWVAAGLKGQTVVTHTHAHGIDFETHYIPWFGESGEVELLTCISTDVTKRVETRKALEELNRTLEERIEHRTVDLQASNDELKEKNDEIQAINRQLRETNNRMITMQKQLVESGKLAALGNLVNGMAHEINTPIGTSITAATHLKSLVDRIASKRTNGEDIKEDLDVLLDDLASVSGIINKNLSKTAAMVQNFKQLSVDQLAEEGREFLFSEYIDEIITNLNLNSTKTGITIKHQSQSTILVYGWPGALTQILTHLYFNAVEHAYSENDTGTITIKSRDEEDHVVIVFQDDGKGMSQEDLDRVFEPFFTTRRHKGMGLGLSVVHSLVTQKWNGMINCQSEIGKGTQIVISLAKGDSSHL